MDKQTVQTSSPVVAVPPGQGEWTELLLAYRDGPAPLFGPLIVRRLERYIDSTARRYSPPHPGIGTDDIHQQLVVEVLEAAIKLPLGKGDDCWVPRRLMGRARTSLRRWLEREAREGHERLDVLMDSDIGPYR